MLIKSEIKQIRDYLTKSQNPLFLFDDDTDGLSSFLLLYKMVNRGYGVVVKSSPQLDEQYLPSVKRNRPDQVYVLDKPKIDQEFIDQVNVPIIWIDHHPPQKVKGVKYFNPLTRTNKTFPVSFMCYQIAEQHLWIAAVGTYGDWHLLPPKLIKQLMKEYPKLLPQVPNSPPEVLFETPLGQLTRIMNFCLKGKSSDIRKNINILSRIDNPYEILDQATARGKFIYKYAAKFNKTYLNLYTRVKKTITREKFVVFTYTSTQHSLTGDLSNELLYNYPHKIIIIGRVKEGRINMSLRKDSRYFDFDMNKLLQQVFENFDGSGGGHYDACGGNIDADQFNDFVSKFKEMVKSF